MSRKSSDDSAVIGCITYLILAILTMPLVGIYLLTRKDASARGIGLILTIVGFALWIMVALHS